VGAEGCPDGEAELPDFGAFPFEHEVSARPAAKRSACIARRDMNALQYRRCAFRSANASRRNFPSPTLRVEAKKPPAVDIFFNETHQLRALWRLLFFVVILVLALVVAGGIVIFANLPDSSGPGMIVAKSLEFLAYATATTIAARITERRTFGDVGYGFASGWLRDAVFGIAFGVALLAVAILPAAFAGALALRVGSADASLGVALVFFMIAAAGEELLCRGFALQALASGIGRAPAAILMSAAFASLHLGNQDVTPVAIAATFIAGILLSIAYFRTRNLWLATGVHFGWNFAMGYVFGLPVSGYRFFPDAPIFVGTLGEPVWLTGGGYGPEGALVVTALIALGCGTLAWIPVPGSKGRVTPES
jgi:membrane protease YdiL (CAAX protease family)